MTVVGDRNRGKAKLAVSESHVDHGGVGVEAVPDYFRKSVDRPRLCLALNEIGLYLDGKLVALPYRACSFNQIRSEEKTKQSRQPLWEYSDCGFVPQKHA